MSDGLDDDPTQWPLVYDNQQVRYVELRKGDYVPGLGIVLYVDHGTCSFAFDRGQTYTYTKNQWLRYGFEGVRRRYLIEEEPV